MKTELLVVSLLLSVMAFVGSKDNTQDEYLRKVLDNLEEIESATYYETYETWKLGDTVATDVFSRFVNEYNNPADTTIGACYVAFNDQEITKFESGYDGHIKASSDHKHNRVSLNNFSERRLPFRLVTPPFYNYTKNIIRYALTTTDNIKTELTDCGDHYFFRLTINEDSQVEFFGKAWRMPKNSYNPDPTSIYELWISKSNDLPYKKRKEMLTNSFVATCSKVTFNQLSLKDFDLYAYFPPQYEIKKQWEKANEAPVSRQVMEGKKAPDWTLNNTDGTPVSLSDMKSKVILLNFTGIGCAPCLASVPFLKTLKESFTANEFDMVAIESWSGQLRAIKSYSDKHKLNYRMLNATEEVLDKYKMSNRGAPYFMLLDEHRMIRKVFFGFSEGKTDEEILKTIRELL